MVKSEAAPQPFTAIMENPHQTIFIRNCWNNENKNSNMECKIVLVTGGTGYIGSWVVKQLLEKNYRVRLAVRDKSRMEKYRHLHHYQAKQGCRMLELWEADLLKDGSFHKAAQGADAIMHVASPFTLKIKDPQKELVDPAVLGTRNVLSAASSSSTVKRVVLTSSVAAIYGDSRDMHDQGLDEFTENHFNRSSSLEHQPYSYSKVTAETEAWKMASGQKQWDLVVINPSFVIGPTLTNASDSESIRFFQSILNGKLFFGAPDIWFGFADVRDVARAHILALENEAAEGRFIISERSMNVRQLTDIIKKYYPGKYRLPLMMAPKPLLMLVGRFFDVTPKFVKNNVGYPLYFNNSRSKNILGLQYHDIEKTVTDMVEQLEGRWKK
jgi:nucleoside-diphosphate-sugar epimerase